MAVEASVSNNCTVISFSSNKFTKSEVEEFRNTFESNLKEGIRTYIVNFEQIEYMDSSALGILVNLLKRLNSDGSILVCSLNPSVLEFFKLTRMDGIFKLFDNIELAINHLEAT